MNVKPEKEQFYHMCCIEEHENILFDSYDINFYRIKSTEFWGHTEVVVRESLYHTIIYAANSKYVLQKDCQECFQDLKPEVISSSPAYEAKCFTYQMFNYVRLTGSCKNLSYWLCKAFLQYKSQDFAVHYLKPCQG